MREIFEKTKNAGLPWGKLAVGALFILVFLMLFTETFSAGWRETREHVRQSHVDAAVVPGTASVGADIGRDGRPGSVAASGQPRGEDSQLIPGDILLGRCELSPVPSLNPAQGWTHACLYIGDGKIMVATQPGVGVIRSSLRSWMYPDMTWVAYLRVTSADREVREKAVEFAVSKKGLPYDANWFSKQPGGESWYCSELVWAAYLQASDGRIDFVRGLDLFGVSPDEIYASDHTTVIGGHYERKPDTILSLLMKVFALCLLAGVAAIAEPMRRLVAWK